MGQERKSSTGSIKLNKVKVDSMIDTMSTTASSMKISSKSLNGAKDAIGTEAMKNIYVLLRELKCESNDYVKYSRKKIFPMFEQCVDNSERAAKKLANSIEATR